MRIILCNILSDHGQIWLPYPSAYMRSCDQIKWKQDRYHFDTCSSLATVFNEHLLFLWRCKQCWNSGMFIPVTGTNGFPRVILMHYTLTVYTTISAMEVKYALLCQIWSNSPNGLLFKFNELSDMPSSAMRIAGLFLGKNDWFEYVRVVWSIHSYSLQYVNHSFHADRQRVYRYFCSFICLQAYQICQNLKSNTASK